ncbi:prepilin peptidase [Streptomyces sp. NPDC058662]|uniref:prepilin peptidase n=1 Tax=Streptomyces sp. NPDC058662 TaxID=3346583 RepID=UPI003652AAF5
MDATAALAAAGDATAVLVVAGAALWGAATGLLVPRAAYRLSVPPREPWRSGCPAGHPLSGPGGGWLGRATCPACGPGSRPYAPAPVAAVLGAAVCATLAAAAGVRPELLVWLALAPFAVLLALVDRAVHRLPDVLTLPLAAATAAGLGLAALLPGTAGDWPRALLGGLALGACYFTLFLINPRGMGFGDVKLALTLGQVLGWYGWPVLFAGTFAAFLAGAVHGLGLMVLRGAGRKAAMPFGPFMLAGALAGVVYAAATGSP